MSVILRSSCCAIYIRFYCYCESFLCHICVMSKKKFTCDEVLGLLFADPDSEGDYFSSEDDGDSFGSDHTDAFPCVPQDGQNVVHQAQQTQSGDSISGVSRGRGDRNGRIRFLGEDCEAGSVGVQSF